MEYKQVEFNEQEIQSFQAFFPDSPGAYLLNRIMVGSAQDYEEILHDPTSSLERVRYAQGALESAGRLGMLVKDFMRLDMNRVEEAADLEEATDVPEMDF